MMPKLTPMALLALCLVPLATAQPWWVSTNNRNADFVCCLSADEDGQTDGRACVVIQKSAGGKCSTALPGYNVRPRIGNANAVCTSDNKGCVDPSEDWSQTFPNYVPPPAKSNPPPPPTPKDPPTPVGPPGGLGGGGAPGGPSGGGAGDPHFSGLDGSRFDFHGRKGGYFALLSESQHQVNALFDNVGEDVFDGIWMTAFGFRFSSNFSLSIAIDKQAYTARTGLASFETADGVTRMTAVDKSDIQLLINGERSDMLQTGESQLLQTPHGVVNLWFPEEYVKHEGDEYDGPLLFLTTPFFDFKVYSESEGTPHLDWRVTVLSDDMDWEAMHGVVGASINWNGMPQLPGTVADYEVPELLGTDFTYTRFVGTQRRLGRRLNSLMKVAGPSKIGRTGGTN